jgi:hypothetical protein
MALSLTATNLLASRLLDCVCEAMGRVPTALPGLHGCPCRKYVSAGTPAADGCDDGCQTLPPGEYPGQLTVHVSRVFTTNYMDFPREVAFRGNATIRDTRNCQPPVTAVDLVVTVFRCAPIPTDQGCPPSPADLEASALQLNVDQLAVQEGLLCCLSGSGVTDQSPKGYRYVMGSSTVIDASGGCVGFTQTVTVALDDVTCCPS